MAWSTPRTWIPGEIATAVMMNANVRDNQNALFGLFTPWVDVAFDPLDFLADDLNSHDCTWTVVAGNITHHAYLVVQNTLFWSFACSASACSGGSSDNQIQYLYLRQPTWRTRNLATSEQISLVSYLNEQGGVYSWVCRPSSGSQLRMEPANGAPLFATHGIANPLTVYFNIALWIL